MITKRARRYTRQTQLANVDPEGRIDVLIYRLISHGMERIEQDKGVRGLREHILPVLEQMIVQHVPQRIVLPQEISALMKFCQLNRTPGADRRKGHTA